MLIVEHILNSHHIEGFRTMDAKLLEEYSLFCKQLIHDLAGSIDLERDSEPFLRQVLMFRMALLENIEWKVFFGEYIERINEEILVVYNHKGVESTIMLDALDLLSRVGVNGLQRMEGLTVQSSYIMQFAKSSLEMEIALILADHYLSNQEGNSFSLDFLKMSYERYGAYAVLSGLWDIKAEKVTEPYFRNIDILTKAIRLKEKYPHLNTAF